MLVTTPTIGRLLARSRISTWRRVTAGDFGPVVKRRGRTMLVDLHHVEARTGRTFSAEQLAAASFAPFKEGFFPVRFRVFVMALTVEQVAEYGLPETPLKEGDQRAGGWRTRYGVEQTEIDALATLRPDVLEAIAREAVAPFHDPTLANRAEYAKQDYETAAQARFDEQAGDRLTAPQAQAEDGIGTVRTSLDALAELVDTIENEITAADAWPDFDMPEPTPSDDGPEPLVSSSMPLDEAIDVLKARKDYGTDD